MMKLIEREELKGKLDNGDSFKLVFCLSENHFQSKHIPGSICIDSIDRVEDNLALDEDIVVYCAGPDCLASVYMYEMLTRSGYTNVRRYEGGVYGWEEAGYPLEGDLVG
jgi:rhodanese-related sulfurtransferase